MSRIHYIKQHFASARCDAIEMYVFVMPTHFNATNHFRGLLQ